MEYLNKSFTVSLGGKAYSDGWEQIWGEKSEQYKRLGELFRRLGEDFCASEWKCSDCCCMSHRETHHKTEGIYPERPADK